MIGPLDSRELAVQPDLACRARCLVVSPWAGGRSTDLPSNHKPVLTAAISCLRPPLEPCPLGPSGLLWTSRRRFDPSSSPSATYGDHAISPSMDRPISQQSGAFRELRLYWRLPSCCFFGPETAFFSRASYFDILVQFRKMNGRSDNLQRRFRAGPGNLHRTISGVSA